MKHFLILSLLIISSFVAKAQEFYALDQIQTIEITFAQSNWDQLLDAEKNGDENYVMAQSISINGVLLDSVGVKYKGNSTYNANQVKNPLHIELDTYKNQDYQGFSDIKLSNVAKDPSFLREVLSYQVIRQYMDAPLSNYANVYINGNLIGLYSNSESVSKKFVNSHFGSKSNTFIKCNPPDGAGPQSTSFPNLVYLGQDSSSYYSAYELKSDFGWNELIDLCDTLSNNTSQIESILDIDRILWMLALDNVMVNLDSYIGAFSQNYYLYRDDYNRFLPVIWDLNESFGRFSSTGNGNLNSTAAKQQFSPFSNVTSSRFPLLSELLVVPEYRRKYLAHFKTILLENFDNSAYYDVALALRSTIDAAVQADNNKFFSYNNFVDNLDSDVSTGGGGPGGGTTNGIANLMDGRSTYLLASADFTKAEPTITSINTDVSNPILGDEITLTAAIGNASYAYLGYRSKAGAPFTKVELLDDGNHNDGSAGDGSYGVSFLVDATYIEYYIYAENAEAGLFSPRRAEYEYYIITATTVDPVTSAIVINEVLASNDAIVADQDGEFDDWIELFNNSDLAIDLGGYSLTDDVDLVDSWTFPQGTLIPAQGYITVWADNDTDQTGLHANFKVSASAENILLTNPDGEVIDEVSLANQSADISYGRYANGTGSFQLMTPTFGAENIGVSAVEENEIVSDNLLVYPNPASSTLTIELLKSDGKWRDYGLFSLTGNNIRSGQIQESITLDVSPLTEGMYILKVENTYTKILISN